MSTWSDLQHVLRAVFICCCCFLLLSIPAAANGQGESQETMNDGHYRQETDTWERGLDDVVGDGRVIHTQRLYTAYRDRLRRNEEVKDKDSEDSVQSAQYVGRLDTTKSKEEEEEPADGKKPVGMLILQMGNVPSQLEASVNTTSKAAHKEEAEDQPNQIYIEEAPQQPVTVPASNRNPESSSKSLMESLTKSGKHGLSALTELLNVFERLNESDIVSDLAKKISDEMEHRLWSNTSLFDDSLHGTFDLASDEHLNELLDEVDPQRTATRFKHILKNLKKRRLTDHPGGLYDDYQKIFSQALGDQNYPRQYSAPSKVEIPMEDDYMRRTIGFNPCRCDNSRPAMLAADQGQVQAKKHIKQKVADKLPSRENNYRKSMETFKMNKENQLNGGLKPYYLPKSKNRQLIWNEVPLIRPGLSPEIHKLKSDSTKKKHFRNEIQKLKAQDSRDFKARPKTHPAPAKDLAPDLHRHDIIDGLNAIKQSPFNNLFDEYQRQMERLRQSFQYEQSEQSDHTPIKRFAGTNEYSVQAVTPVPFPEALIHRGGMGSAPQMGGNMINNMASQMNISPLEMAQRIVGSNGSPASGPGQGQGQGQGSNSMASDGRMGLNAGYGPFQGQTGPGPGSYQNSIPSDGRMELPPGYDSFQGQSGNQISSGHVPYHKSSKLATQETPPQDPPAQEPPTQKPSKIVSSTQDPDNIAPVLEKILQRLETMQKGKCGNETADEKDLKDLACCFTDPADGAPCDIDGSWESLVLGVRINIRTPKNKKFFSTTEEKKQTCINPKQGKSRRQCVKINQSQLKDKADTKKEELLQSGVMINVSVQETVPPRAHVIIENITDWDFSGHALRTMGGPVSLAFRKLKSSLVGNFVGYCRTCGCVDTIFGSWTFCQPSRDCQDITMSIVDRRDLLRRYSLDEKRMNRYKEQLYLGSKFAQKERERMEAEIGNYEKPTPPPQLQEDGPPYGYL
ncbi:uncharacterized protein LOC108155995 [Drosophila miranda]|uniref:uncharacterized protein LOC108155995 n=1 Tax=Drosophila miranda TaxID=7229 RepID=UPI00143F6B24|nr:uncharacterized protein LOC108155995 [Drosophila miranda]